MSVKGNGNLKNALCLSVCRALLVVVFLLLLSPVLVELVDFYSCIALLKQVKSLRMNQKTQIIRSRLGLAKTGKKRFFLFILRDK